MAKKLAEVILMVDICDWTHAMKLGKLVESNWLDFILKGNASISVKKFINFYENLI